MTSYPETGLPAPIIAPGVRTFMAATMAQHPGAEYSWACTWDKELHAIVGARLIGRGSPMKALIIPRDLQAGELAVHSHPSGAAVIASDEDLAGARELDFLGIGSAVVSQDANQLYVIREPRPRLTAPERRSRCWTWRRLIVIWTAKRETRS